MSWNTRIVARLLITGMLASAIGGLLLTSHGGHSVAARQSEVTPASQTMMLLVHDEHELGVWSKRNSG
jgi:hypothetical protein